MGIQSSTFMPLLLSVIPARTKGRREDHFLLPLRHSHVGSGQTHRAPGSDVCGAPVDSRPDDNYNRVHRGLDKYGNLGLGRRNIIVGSQES